MHDKKASKDASVNDQVQSVTLENIPRKTKTIEAQPVPKYPTYESTETARVYQDAQGQRTSTTFDIKETVYNSTLLRQRLSHDTRDESFSGSSLAGLHKFM